VTHDVATKRIGHRQHFHDANPLEEAGLRAFLAAFRVIERDVAIAVNLLCINSRQPGSAFAIPCNADATSAPAMRQMLTMVGGAGGAQRPCRQPELRQAASLVCTVDKPV
jgi:hypothetical protein